MYRLLVVLSVTAALCVAATQAAHPVRFEVKWLAVDLNEGCDIADVDGDGRLDIVAGRNWYRNPEWIPRPLRLIEDNNGYVRSNGEWAYDVNGDGRPDVLSLDFFSSDLYWYENPGPDPLQQGQLWPKHLLGDTGCANNEVSYLVDLTGDGRPEWISNQWNPENPTIICSLVTAERDGKAESTLVKHTIAKRNAHGIGFGDINNDGRPDILFGGGWLECPTGDPLQQPWSYHADWDKKHAACPMLVYDIDGDGTNDVINSAAHGFGIHWWRGLGPDDEGRLQFEEHLIDDSFSQAHCFCLADLDGDGSEELITGKRIRAHNGNDPGGTEPPIMRYYVWNAANQAFDGYTINQGQVGGGLQIRTADLDADGDIDIVVAGKDGTQILFNKQK